MRLVPARTYQDVLWNRANNPSAIAWWNLHVRWPVYMREEGKCCFCKELVGYSFDLHHLPEAYDFIGLEDTVLHLLKVAHHSCHMAHHKGTKKRRFWR